MSILDGDDGGCSPVYQENVGEAGETISGILSIGFSRYFGILGARAYYLEDRKLRITELC